jgi:hypothetical protein
MTEAFFGIKKIEMSLDCKAEEDMMIGLVAYIPDRPRSETTRPCRDSTIPYVYTRLSFNLTPLSDQPIVARLQYIPTYAQKMRTHSSFAREMATEPQSKTRLAEICNRRRNRSCPLLSWKRTSLLTNSCKLRLLFPQSKREDS